MVTTEARPDIAAMDAPHAQVASAPLKLRLPTDWVLTDHSLIALSNLNEPWQFEVTARKELVIMSPEGPDSSERGGEIHIDLGIWNRQQRLGRVFGAQLGVRNPDGSLLAPDVAWISNERWEQRDPDQGFLSVCPELIVEVVSPSSSYELQQAKMAEWIRHGALLGWLIDPFQEIVVVYRAEAEAEQLERPDTLSGEDVCDGLVVNLERIWK